MFTRERDNIRPKLIQLTYYLALLKQKVLDISAF